MKKQKPSPMVTLLLGLIPIIGPALCVLYVTQPKWYKLLP